jgi:hypothetical protein
MKPRTPNQIPQAPRPPLDPRFAKDQRAEERLDRVLDAVAAERERQEQKHGLLTCAHGRPNAEKFLVLSEEFGEVAEALQRPGQFSTRVRAHLRTELIQLAAVSVAWAESLTEEPK